MHRVVDRTQGIHAQPQDAAKLVDLDRIIGLLLAEGLTHVVLIVGQERVRVGRPCFPPVHANARVSGACGDADGLQVGHRLYGGFHDPARKLAVPIRLGWGIGRRSGMVVSVAQEDVGDRDARSV